jgi:hypothetical protein
LRVAAAGRVIEERYDRATAVSAAIS